MTIVHRNPVVAGAFYPGTSDSLKRQLESLIAGAEKKEAAIGIVSPHAGYIYSGYVAGSVFSSIVPRQIYIIMGPNHTGLGESFGLSTSDFWNTPLGEVEVDKALAEEIKKNCKYIKDDDLSSSQEHSIEVQLPFLQFIQKNPRIVPIVIAGADLDAYRAIGNSIAKSVKDMKLERKVTIIASSDMTHYESHEAAKRKDSAAIEAILALDEERLTDAVSEMNISMCGYAPTAIMIAAAKRLGAKSARLVKYQTSGDSSGDYSSVVGYAGIVIT